MKQNKTACVVFYTDDRYDELVKNVKNSFIKFNGNECDYYQIDYTNQLEYNNSLFGLNLPKIKINNPSKVFMNFCEINKFYTKIIDFIKYKKSYEK